MVESGGDHRWRHLWLWPVLILQGVEYMSIKKSGSAVWEGSLKEGKGQISTESGVLKDVAYGFGKRFEGEPGSNPEELIGAAHASCYSMADRKSTRLNSSHVRISYAVFCLKKKKKKKHG